MAKIKVQQDAILADYAEGCRADVQSCLSTNGYDESNTASTVSRTAVNACSSEITTCMSVGGYTPKDGTKLTLRAMNDWVSSMLINCSANYYLKDNADGKGKTECKYCPMAQEYKKQCTGDTCSYTAVTGSTIQTVSAGGQATTCSCPEGYSDYYLTGDETTLDNLKCLKNSD